MSAPSQRANPGSDEAVAAGCVCPRMDNGYGVGRRYGADGGRPYFVMVLDCPYHRADVTAIIQHRREAAGT